MTLRLFVAVDVPEDVRMGLHGALDELRSKHPWVRWTDPSGWHLTLAFLGWVAEEHVVDVHDALLAATRAAKPFELSLDGRLASFGRRVLWAGIRESDPLGDLAESVRAELAARGRCELEERPFHAHLTVARAPADRRLPKALGADWQGPQTSWGVTEALMMRSHLRRAGARYEVWARAPFSRE